MAIKVTCVAGLPASGKTSWARVQLSENASNCTHILDDTWHHLGFDAFLKLLRQLVRYADSENTEAHVIIVGADLCLADRRKFLTGFLNQCGVDVISWVFFENDPVQCRSNATLRPQKDVRATIDLFTLAYNIPEGAEVLPCYRPKKNKK